MTRWAVRHVCQGLDHDMWPAPLGTVEAAHSPGAVRQATNKWPELTDWSKPQAGFSVRKEES